LKFNSVGGVPRPIFSKATAGYANYVKKLKGALNDKVRGGNIMIC
jgi:hypothetical protein